MKILLSGVPLAGVFLTPSPTRAEPEKKRKENTSKMLRDENQRTEKRRPESKHETEAMNGARCFQMKKELKKEGER